MRGKRLVSTIRMWTMRSNVKRTEYLRKNQIFGAIGKNTTIMDRTIPLYARLIRLGDNVKVASNVKFITHDITFRMLNLHPDLNGEKFNEKLGCIEVGNNVFIGSGTTILYDVKIGSNVIIGANSLVTKDIPDNSVAAGTPAKVIGTFDSFLNKRRSEAQYPAEMAPSKEMVSTQLENLLWEKHYEKRSTSK